MSTLKARRRARGDAPTFRVALACNGDGGHFAGICEAITITSRTGETVELEPCRGGAPRLTILDDGKLRIFRRLFPFSASKDWVGNWCWNEYVMRLDDVARLLAAAISGPFSCTAASGDAACALSDLLDEDAEEYQIRDALLRMAVAA